MVRDEELALLVRDGDRDAFGVLVGRHAPAVRRLCRAVLHDPDEADDAAQDAFLSALTGIGSYNSSRPFRPWLMRVAANAARDRLRRLRVRRTEPLDPAAHSTDSPVRDALRSELRDRLAAALRELPERQRMALVLFDVEGYSHGEIAEILDVPEGTARSDLFQARRRMREVLAPWREEENENRS